MTLDEHLKAIKKLKKSKPDKHEVGGLFEPIIREMTRRTRKDTNKSRREISEKFINAFPSHSAPIKKLLRAENSIWGNTDREGASLDSTFSYTQSSKSATVSIRSSDQALIAQNNGADASLQNPNTEPGVTIPFHIRYTSKFLESQNLEELTLSYFDKQVRDDLKSRIGLISKRIEGDIT